MDKRNEIHLIPHIVAVAWTTKPFYSDFFITVIIHDYYQEGRYYLDSPIFKKYVLFGSALLENSSFTLRIDFQGKFFKDWALKLSYYKKKEGGRKKEKGEGGGGKERRKQSSHAQAPRRF